MPPQHGIDVGQGTHTRTILWLHGYTGCPSAFESTLVRLSAELDAHCVAPLLPGHGTQEENLVGLGFDDFLKSAREAGERLALENKPLTIVGYSFGGYLAAELAQELHASALVIALTPYRGRARCNLPGLGTVMRMRSFWRKPLTSFDRWEREGTFYYPRVPSSAFSLIKEGNSRIKKILPLISCPILTVHNAGDPLAHPKSGPALLSQSGHNAHNEAQILPEGRHALFFRPHHDQEEQVLKDFIIKNA